MALSPTMMPPSDPCHEQTPLPFIRIINSDQILVIVWVTCGVFYRCCRALPDNYYVLQHTAILEVSYSVKRSYQTNHPSVAPVIHSDKNGRER